jgi:hypothetical protein
MCDYMLIKILKDKKMQYLQRSNNKPDSWVLSRRTGKPENNGIPSKGHEQKISDNLFPPTIFSIHRENIFLNEDEVKDFSDKQKNKSIIHH